MSEQTELYQIKRKSYLAQRAASNNAAITLVCGSEEYVAQFECAQKVNKLLPQIKLHEYAKIPFVRIPLHDMKEACTKLSSFCSVALVDHARDQYKESRFYCVWRIACTGAEKPILLEPKKPSTNLDDY